MLPASALAQTGTTHSNPASDPISESVSSDAADSSQQDEDAALVAKTIDEAADLLIKQMWAHYVRVPIRWDNDAIEPTYDTVDEIIELAARKSGDYPFGEASVYGGIETGTEDGAPYTDIVFICKYYITDEQNTQLCKKADEVLRSLDISDSSSDYEIVRAIYDYICANVTYDYENLPNDDYKLKYTAYAALVNKTAVCNGYAMLMSRMLTQMGISCRLIIGTNLNGCAHAWNIVGIDGIYYYVDSTWDAGKKPENYKYFLRGESDFTEHIVGDKYTTDEFKSMYPMSETRYVECPSHSFGEWTVVSAADCTKTGVETRKCANCGRLERRETPVLGHDYGEWTVTKEPTCTETGVKVRTCTRCGATETSTVETIAHDIIHHEAKAPTCTEAGWEAYDTCSRCDYTTYKELPALGHDYAEWTVTKEPTCTKAGTEVGSCTRCGAVGTRTVAALGHDYKNGVCTRCGAEDANYIAAPVPKITTSSGKPKISWSKVDGAVKYQVFCSTDGKKYSLLVTTEKTSVTNTKATIGTTYYYKVKAVRDDGFKSDYSIVKTIKCVPAAPTMTLGRSGGKAKLSWKASTGATKYWIYRSTDGKNYEYRTYTTKLSYTDSKSASGTKYHYKVRAVAVVDGANAISGYSAAKGIKTTLAAPTLKITTSNGKPSISWDAVYGATGYYIFRSSDGKSYDYLGYTNKLSYTDSNATARKTYYYKVKSDDGGAYTVADTTSSKTAENLVKQAKSWLGCKESDLSNKEIIDIYNNHEPVARGVKLGYTAAWCAAFVSACSIKTGMTDIIPTESGCGSMVKLFQELGEWDESDARIPNVGDIIFFDWDDNGYGDNRGFPGHVGVVEKVSGSVITVIDGNNKKDAVGRRTVRINGRFIRGYGVPKYDGHAASDTRSAFSSAVSTLCKPSAPTVTISRSNGKPKLTWKAVTGASKYYIYRSTDGKTYKQYTYTTKTSYTNTGAASGKKYYYKVKAVAVVNGNNIFSSYSAAKSMITTLATPTVSITTANGKPKVSWKAVTGADKYIVYRSTDGKTFKQLSTTAKTSLTNTSANKNAKYYYKVKAVCSANTNANSALSKAVSIKATK